MSAVAAAHVGVGDDDCGAGVPGLMVRVRRAGGEQCVRPEHPGMIGLDAQYYGISGERRDCAQPGVGR